MTREEAIKEIKSWDFLEGKELEAIGTLIPELKESAEDERIYKEIMEFFKMNEKKCSITNPYPKWIAWLEKQKDASKAIEAVDRIDKYIDEHVANAHDMKDSNPDKKYYRGWDDALGKMSGILQDVYSGEKQKEQKPEHFELKAGKWYICHRAFCCRADHLTVKEGERFMCEKDGVVKGFVIKEPEKYFKECSVPAPMEDEQKGQKPAEWSEEDNEVLQQVIADIEDLIAAETSPGFLAKYNKHLDWLKLLPERFYLTPKQEWSEEDEKTINDACCWIAEYAGYLMNKNYGKASMLMGLTEKLKSLRPSWKPSEEQLKNP